MPLGALTYGLLLWTIGTLALRLSPARLLQPSRPLITLAIYAASFLLIEVNPWSETKS